MSISRNEKGRWGKYTEFIEVVAQTSDLQMQAGRLRYEEIFNVRHPSPSAQAPVSVIKTAEAASRGRVSLPQ